MEILISDLKRQERQYDIPASFHSFVQPLSASMRDSGRLLSFLLICPAAVFSANLSGRSPFRLPALVRL